MPGTGGHAVSFSHRAERLVSRGARSVGLSRALRTLHQRRLLILNYHGVVPEQYARDPRLHPDVVSVKEFAQQMAEVARLFRPIRVSELRNWQAGMDRAVLITFDDGFRNNLTYAAPVLRQFGIPALIAVCPGYIGQKRLLWPDEIQWRVLHWPEKTMPMPFSTPPKQVPAEYPARLALATYIQQFCKRLPWERVAEYFAVLRRHPLCELVEDVHAFLSWNEVRILQKCDFDIASHTMDHPILTRLPLEKLQSELRESKRIIEQEINGECTCFAYPNGGITDYSPVVVEQVRRTGYQFAFTVTGRLAAPQDNPLLLDRIYVPGLLSPAEFDSRISGFRSILKRFLAA